MLLDDAGAAGRGAPPAAHVYVDELADTDPAQLDLLAVVAGGGKPLVAFADPDSVHVRLPRRRPGRGAATSRTGSAPRAGRRPPQVAADHVYRAGPSWWRRPARLAAGCAGRPARTGGCARCRTRRPAPSRWHLRSATSESAWLAHALREAHLLDGMPWSRMAVWSGPCGHQHAALRRALHTGRRAATVVRGEDTALATQPAVAPLLLLLRCALDEPVGRRGGRQPAALPLGGADPLPKGGCARGCARRRPARRPPASGELLVESLRIRASWPPSTGAGPVRPSASPPCWPPHGELASRRGPPPEDVLWAVWRGTGLAERWGGAPAPARRPARRADRRPRSGRGDGALRRGGPVHRPVARRRIEIFLDHVLDQELPADTLAATADRGEAVRMLTAHAAKGLEWDLVAVAGVQEGVWPDLRLRGSLLGSRAAGGRARRPGTTARPAGHRSGRYRRCSTRSAGCSTSRSAGPGGGCW